MDHELVRLAGRIDWEWVDGELADRFSDKGRPATETRFMVGLLFLKHMFGLSDEGVCERWSMTPISSILPARSSSSTPPERAIGTDPLARPYRRQAGPAPPGEPQGGA